MKALDVPITSITDLKKSPMEIILQAEREQNGVYILNHNKNVGVILTVEQYDALIRKIEQLEDENSILPRLEVSQRVLLSDEQVRGEKNVNMSADGNSDDGWE